ncbi:MAG: universal stress protein [Nocardioides sp.]|uniref:universal stress protein n=1 Tax=Nocardioides sp. TaxID=35761 RepID=UPI0039E4702F
MSETAELAPSGVVVGDDGSANARAAVEFAAEEATRRGLPLHVIRCYSMSTAPRPDGLPFGYVPSEAELGESLRAFLEKQWAGLAAPSVEVHVVAAPAAQTLISAGDTATVLVVGACGQGRLEGLLLGSVADKVVRLTSCPVIVVKRTRDLQGT